MSKKSSSQSLSLWLQILSLVGLGLILLIVFRTALDPPSLDTQPQLIGFLFISICLLGAVVGVRPSVFSRPVSEESRKTESDKSQEIDLVQQQPNLQGHHYTCDPFSDHVLHIGSRIYCAGCTGLTTGAIFSILGSFVYFFLGILLINELLVFWIGFFGVLVGLVQHQLYRLFLIRNGFLRFTLNVVFVIGAFLLLVASNQITGDLTVDLYILCVILLWILTRIMMSKGEHERVCVQCNDGTCSHPLC